MAFALVVIFPTLSSRVGGMDAFGLRNDFALVIGTWSLCRNSCSIGCSSGTSVHEGVWSFGSATTRSISATQDLRCGVVESWRERLHAF
jgi:hypothetical protein